MGHLQELDQDQNGIQLRQWGQEGTRKRQKVQTNREGGEGKRVRGMT